MRNISSERCSCTTEMIRPSCLLALSFCCMAMGLLLILQAQPFESQMNPGKFYAISSLLLVVAMIAIAASVLGCVGAHKKKILFVILFIFLAFIAVICALTAGIYLMKARENIEEIFPEKPWYMRPGEDQLYHFQAENECCGYIGPDDYITFQSPDPIPRENLPPSCCPGFVNCTRASPDLFQTPCRDVLLDNIRNYQKVAFILCALMAIICSLILVCGVFELIILLRMRKMAQSNMEPGSMQSEIDARKESKRSHHSRNPFKKH